METFLKSTGQWEHCFAHIWKKSRQVETEVRHFLDLFEELEAENHTMRIAATRSSRLYGLEGSNPKFWVGF